MGPPVVTAAITAMSAVVFAGGRGAFNARDFPSWYTTPPLSTQRAPSSHPLRAPRPGGGLSGASASIICPAPRPFAGSGLLREVGPRSAPRWGSGGLRSERAPAVAGDSGRGGVRHAAPRFRCMAERGTRRASSSARVAPRGHPACPQVQPLCLKARSAVETVEDPRRRHAAMYHDTRPRARVPTA